MQTSNNNAVILMILNKFLLQTSILLNFRIMVEKKLVDLKKLAQVGAGQEVYFNFRDEKGSFFPFIFIFIHR